MRVLVTGAGGTMGSALRALNAWPDAVYAERACDVRDPNLVRETVNRVQPDVVVHAAAITDHQTPNAADLIATNVLGTLNVAQEAERVGARLVYLSTHYVYSGSLGMYSEESLCFPIGAYAMSKYAGERVTDVVLNDLRQDVLIVRGSWYTKAKLALWSRQGALVDAWCSREPVEDAARKIVKLVRTRVGGVVNIGGPRRTFAQIVRDEGLNAPRLTRDALDASGALPYAFPPDSSVSTKHYEELCGGAR